MAIGSVNLTSSMRTNLVSLQNTASMMSNAENHLSTGNKINTAVDNPASFFAAQGQTSRASQLGSLKDNIGQAIQTVNSASNGITGEQALIESLRGVITQARSAINDTVNSATILGGSKTGGTSGLTSQYNSLIGQLNNLVNDSSYQGVNFLTSGSAGTAVLTVNFNENASTSITVSGFNAGASGLGISGGGTTKAVTANSTGNLTSGSINNAANLNKMEASLNTALATLQTQSSALASNLSILTARQSFITSMVNTLTVGSTNLVGADTNTESANLLTLQTQNQLGVTALSMSNQANSAVLKLF